MRITCLGASRCVTGSSFLIENGRKYLVDCGLFQGGAQMEKLNHAPWALIPRRSTRSFSLTLTSITAVESPGW